MFPRSVEELLRSTYSSSRDSSSRTAMRASSGSTTLISILLLMGANACLPSGVFNGDGNETGRVRHGRTGRTQRRDQTPPGGRVAASGERGLRVRVHYAPGGVGAGAPPSGALGAGAGAGASPAGAGA